MGSGNKPDDPDQPITEPTPLPDRPVRRASTGVPAQGDERPVRRASTGAPVASGEAPRPPRRPSTGAPIPTSDAERIPRRPSTGVPSQAGEGERPRRRPTADVAAQNPPAPQRPQRRPSVGVEAPGPLETAKMASLDDQPEVTPPEAARPSRAIPKRNPTVPPNSLRAIAEQATSQMSSLAERVAAPAKSASGRAQPFSETGLGRALARVRQVTSFRRKSIEADKGPVPWWRTAEGMAGLGAAAGVILVLVMWRALRPNLPSRQQLEMVFPACRSTWRLQTGRPPPSVNHVDFDYDREVQCGALKCLQYSIESTEDDGKIKIWIRKSGPEWMYVGAPHD